MPNPILVTAALSALLLSSVNSQAAAARKPATPPQAMSAGEVADMYQGRSWIWQNGAGFFGIDRRFLAWSGSGKSTTYAAGKWSVSNSGRLCFNAAWHNVTGARSKLTCFSHRKDGETVYQKSEPSGVWYVFRHTPTVATDEYQKLLAGDQVTSGFKRAAAEVKRHSLGVKANLAEATRQKLDQPQTRTMLNEAYDLYNAGKYRDVLAKLGQGGNWAGDRRDAGALKGWALFKLNQYDKAREEFATLDKELSTRETQYGLYYSGAMLDPTHRW